MKRLNQFRIEAGYSIADIARSTGVDQSTACRWLCGTAYPEAEQREKLAALFGVDAQELDEHDAETARRRIDRFRSRLTVSRRMMASR